MTKKIGLITILLGLIAITFLACQKDTLPLTAYFKAFPTFGDSRTVFHFDASKTLDGQQVNGGLKIRWDWQGDSVWDTPFTLDHQVARRFDTAGCYYVTLQVMDHSGNTAIYKDTIDIWSSFPETGELVDPRDGQKYNTVKFNEVWLMSENLRFGTWIPDSVFPSQQTGPEYYLYNNDVENMIYGGLYTWQEMMNYREEEGGQGLCPDGWHVPSFEEWHVFFGWTMIYDGRTSFFDFPIPINMEYYYGANSSSGINILFYGTGLLKYPKDQNFIIYSGQGESIGYWTSHPLYDGYYGERKVQFCTNMYFTKYQYGIQSSYNKFDAYLKEKQPALRLNYIRCFKNQD